MFKKLIKYDLKNLSKSLFPIYTISLITAVLANIAKHLFDLTPVFRIPMVFITILAVLISIGVMFLTVIIGIEKFYKQTVKDEGYLIHTLPVKKSQIILSKLITLLIFELISFIITIITMLIIINVNPSDIYDLIKYLFESIFQIKLSTIILMVLTIIISQANSILLVYASISFGQKHSKNKLLYSIIDGIIIYNVSEIISLVITLPLLLNPEYVEELEKTIPSSSILNMTLLLALAASLVLTIVYYVLTKKNLEKKLNLE